MPAIQSVMGSIGASSNLLSDPGGWWSYMNNPVSDQLLWRIYSGYHNENSDISGLPLLESGGGVPNLEVVNENETHMFTGYIMLPADGNYIFRTISDDGSYFWIGTNAWDGNYNINNALINNGGLHGSDPMLSSPITITGNVWYPIRILSGNNLGPGYLTFHYTPVGDRVNFYNPTFAYNSGSAEGFN